VKQPTPMPARIRVLFLPEPLLNEHSNIIAIYQAVAVEVFAQKDFIGVPLVGNIPIVWKTDEAVIVKVGNVTNV